MIDWKDVNKELPTKVGIYNCKAVDAGGNVGEEKMSYNPSFERFTTKQTYQGDFLRFYKDSNFDGDLGMILTHWAYINKPEEK